MNINYKRQGIIVLLIVILLNTGCSTMSQSECTMANWHDVGQNDGEDGKKSTHYSRYQNDCSEFGIGVDTSAYKNGWETGIANYCTKSNGYRVGTSGGFYQNSCPAIYEDEFFSAYQMGRSIHTHQSQVNRLQNQISKTGDDLEKTGLTTEEHRSLTDKRRRLKDDLNAANIRLILAVTEARRYGFPAVF